MIIMMKVISTKLPVDQAKRFHEVAEAQGETRSSLLKRLILECLQSADEEDEPIPASIPHQGAVLTKDLYSEYPPQDPRQKQTKTLTSTSRLDNNLLGNESVDRFLNSASLSTSRQPVYHNTEPSRSATSREQSSDIGVIILLLLIVWGLCLTPVDTDGRAPKRLAQGIGAGIYRQRYHS
jgi:hypothetical protein